MDANFVITCIVQICHLTLLSVDVKGVENYFELITDPLLVETLAMSAAQIESQRDSESPAPDVIAEEETIEQTIFNRNQYEILQLCADAIPIETYGFQFELGSYRGPKTVKRSFQVARIEPPTNELLQLQMLNYPRISYLDLETNERHKSLDWYFLSQATDGNSAILFKKQHEDGATYPLRCMTKISFEKLTLLSITAMNLGARFPPDPVLDKIVQDLDAKRIADTIVTYQTLKRSTSVYVKFRKLFASLSVCGLPRRHKIHACRLAIETSRSPVKLDVEDYFEEPCKKRLVHFTDGSAGDSAKTAELCLSRCPPTLNMSVSKPLRQTTMFYVASNTSRRSVLLFSRLNMKGERIQPLKVIYNVDTLAMKQDKMRARLFSTLPVRPSVSTRELAYESLKKTINYHLPGFEQPVQTPLALARRRGPVFDAEEEEQSKPRFIHGGLTVERAVVEFSQIKENVFVYEKFRETYRSIDFCSLSCLQRKSLCDEVLSDAEYELTPNPHFVGKVEPCYRQMVALTSIEAERLQTEKFSLWGCPPTLDNQNRLYYMGKSHLKDAAILFREFYSGKKFDNINAIHPVTLFLNINRYKLARLIPVQ